MTEQNRSFDDSEPHVSDRLRKDLRDLFTPPGTVPTRLDQAIRSQASRRLAKPRRLIIRLRWAGVAAAAAVIVVGIILYQAPLDRSHPAQMANLKSVSPAPAEGGADVDGNGRVDILDAFRLARQIETRGPADQRWDLNGDGRVDKDDVDLVAAAAVRLASQNVAMESPWQTRRVACGVSLGKGV
jgi:hypothetical protein